MEPGYVLFATLVGIGLICATLFAAYNVLFDKDFEMEDYEDE
jgi:hypothetical protein